MDNKFQLLGFRGSPHSLNAFQIQSKMQSKFYLCADARHRTLYPESTGTSGPCDLSIRGIKRKWTDAGGIEGPEDGFLLRHSPSSSDSSSMSSTSTSTLSLAKDTDEESSMDIELNFQLYLGSGGETLKPKNDVVDAGKAVESGPSDPKLSLPTGSSTSAITTASPVSVQRAEFSVGPLLNALPSASADSAQARPNLAAAPTSSSVTCISKLKHIQQWTNDTYWFQGCEGKVVNAPCPCISHGNCRTCKRESFQGRPEDANVYCRTHYFGLREKVGDCIDGHQHCKQCPCICTSRGGPGPALNLDKMSQMENCSKSAEVYHAHCSSNGGGRHCQFPNCSKYALMSTLFCKAHCGGRGGCCVVPDCTKSARGGTAFCAPHGGGKRCRVKGCGKSAKGSIDFCRNHSVSNKCPWGHPRSDLGKGEPPCDQYAQGKTGFCAAHKALVQDRRVHGGMTVKPDSVHKLCLPSLGVTNFCTGNEHNSFAGTCIPEVSQSGLNNLDVLKIIPIQCVDGSVTEGRVHGGSLMAILKNGAEAGGKIGNCSTTSPLAESVPPCTLPHKWN